ncbi:MAG TPA: hypothetical protein VJS92_02910 [Candidatus Polarisedimenticolaceae bacterium]|nr:hypothetical protein [Candidatus Polarisedimenticolaceae bacterium]
MSWIVGKIKGIMLVSGVLTCTMIYAAIAPAAAIRSTFGVSLDEPAALIVVRNWGALIALVGAMLVYGAYNPGSRPLVLGVAGASKLVFIGLVLAEGGKYLGYQAGVAVAIDLLTVVLFATYLARTRPWAPAANPLPPRSTRERRG